MKKTNGTPLPLGVTVTKEKINFSVAVEQGQTCQLLLYRAGEQTPCETWDMPESEALGNVRFLSISDIDAKDYEYNYLIDNQVVTDPYTRATVGRELWGNKTDSCPHEVRGVLYEGTYDWEGDKPLQIPYHDVIAYSLHVRGFTKHSSSKVKHKGTFAGLIEKIPYLNELGINQIQCMPIYDFEECMSYRNYWGYGNAYIFSPKASYASANDAGRELKDMIKACHKAGIEVVLYFPFTPEIPQQMMEACLRYYVMEYHVDGFVLNPFTAPMEAILGDPILGKTKIMKKQDTFQNVMRRFLKGDEGMVDEVIWWLRHHSKEEGIFNYITEHTGFTLADLVSYDGKHNEANGEQNQDGPEYNYSWNCGAEGQTRKKAVLELRKHQMRNAFFLLLSSQGTPCLLAGDEFANSQKGNNNVYCQDNATAWIDWKKLEKEQELFQYVKGLITLRKNYGIMHQKEKLSGVHQSVPGIPDVSYHGESAWQVPSEIASRQLGVYYCGEGTKDRDCYVAYNMHWIEHSFALPTLQKGMKWYQIVSTKDGVLEKPQLLENQKEITLESRSIAMLVGR